MPHFNKSFFMGHVGQDAKLMTSNDGSKQWASFTVAVSTGTMDMPETTWVKASIWHKPERVLEKIKKGAAVFISGPIKIKPYNKKQDGQAAVDVSMTVNDWILLGSNKSAGSPSQSNDAPVYNSTVTGFSDDLPF